MNSTPPFALTADTSEFARGIKDAHQQAVQFARHLATPAKTAKTPLGQNQSMTYRHVGVVRQNLR